MGSSDHVEIDVIIKKVRPLAILVTDTATDQWLPVSQIVDYDENEHAEGVECELTIPEWLAIEKGFA